MWNLEELLGGKTTDQIIDEIKSDVQEFKQYRNKLKDATPEIVFEIIKKKEEINTLFSNLSAYYSMKSSVNTKDTKVLAMQTKLGQLGTDMSNEMMFFSLWFIELDDVKAKEFLDSKKLEYYDFYLKNIRKYKQFTKSEEIEKIINIKDETGSDSTVDIYEIYTTDFKFEFNGEPIAKEELVAKFKSSNPKEREEAYKLVYGRYKENSILLSEMYKNIVMDWNNEALKIRGFKDSAEERHLSNNVTPKAVEAMTAVARKNFSLFKDFFKTLHELNKKAGSEYEFSRYHIYAPFAKEVEKEYSYEESKKIAMDTLKEFDDEIYVHAMEIFDKNHVHSHPDENKRGGAYCYGPAPNVAPYIFLNHTNKLRDLFTIAHEFGHGIHDQLARKHSILYYHPGICMAETASVFNEVMLSEKMLENAKTSEEKTSLLVMMLGDAYATIARQTGFYLFEKEAHKMIPSGATKEELDETYYSLLKEMFGDMKIPEEFKSEWNYIPHIHASPFYVYGYSWGQLMVYSLFQKYKDEGKPFIDKYKSILAAGGSKPAVDLLGDLGFDLESEDFWQKGFDKLYGYMNQLKEINK